MKKLLFVFILLTITATTTTVQGSPSNDLLQLTHFYEATDREIDQWQVIMKEQKDKQEIDNIIKELKNSYKVTRIEDENRIKLQLGDSHNSKSFSVLYNVVLPKDNITPPELIVVFEGTKWSSKIKGEYELEFDDVFMQYFTSKGNIFSWLKGTSSDTIDEDVFVQEFTNYYYPQHITTQVDKTNHSRINKFVYGYIPTIKQNLVINHTPVNVQLAITTNETGMTEYTVGTPILINEY
ncbi:hypothetical protein D8M04_15315 [Oceanobacillus piezotolerans]|uniref:TATA-box binding n=1 Tax=Oceanobacillus piezotolerans TaxID=2448030 RepID=A0A498D8N7_9BACI|nr:YwmB family TATA-box binding protein [Oceanobacillus piezotolerans]RLL42913.1 hypothetical protein D8M04_15315 [Oceanobacillus piezotolerans]